MNETGFAIGDLIIAASEVAHILERHDPEAGKRLYGALEAVGVDRKRLTKPPLKALNTTVPLVLYFRTQQDAEEFTELVRSAMANPIAIDLGGNDKHEQ